MKVEDVMNMSMAEINGWSMYFKVKEEKAKAERNKPKPLGRR